MHGLFDWKMRWVELSIGLQIQQYFQYRVAFSHLAGCCTMLSNMIDGKRFQKTPLQLTLGFFSLSFTRFGPFLKASSSVFAAGSWDRCVWLSLTVGFLWGLRVLDEAALWGSEGFKTGPLGGHLFWTAWWGAKEHRKGRVGIRGVKWRVRRRKWSKERSFWWTCVVHSCCLDACWRCSRL